MASRILTIGDTAEATFPWLSDATDFVKSMGIATPKSFSKMQGSIRDTTFTVGGVDSITIIADFKDIVQQGIDTGASVDETTAKMLERADIKIGEAERVIRDTTKQAYLKTWRQVSEKPAIKKIFGYVKFIATRDSRVRPEHAAMDGFVCSVDDPAYQVMLELLAENNCRCTIISLTPEKAEAQGIKTAADLPDFEALAESIGHCTCCG